jgi:hypothetical protein
MLSLLCKFIIAHTFADFVFQHDRMAYGKSRHNKSDVHWFHWLTSHSIINGAMIYILIGYWYIALLEVGLHWIIDLLKCEKITNVEYDQLLHLITKIAYVVMICR